MYYSIDPPGYGSAGPILEGLLNRIFSFGVPVPASVSNHCTVYSTYLLFSPLAPESFLRRRPCTRIYADKGQVFAMGRAKMLVFNPFTNFFVIFAKIYRWQNTIICYWRIRTDTSTVRNFRENDFVHTLVCRADWACFPQKQRLILYFCRLHINFTTEMLIERIACREAALDRTFLVKYIFATVFLSAPFSLRDEIFFFFWGGARASRVGFLLVLM